MQHTEWQFHSPMSQMETKSKLQMLARLLREGAIEVRSKFGKRSLIIMLPKGPPSAIPDNIDSLPCCLFHYVGEHAWWIERKEKQSEGSLLEVCRGDEELLGDISEGRLDDTGSPAKSQTSTIYRGLHPISQLSLLNGRSPETPSQHWQSEVLHIYELSRDRILLRGYEYCQSQHTL